LIFGKRCPVIGRVTMDQIMVDISHVPGARIGTEAVILGTQGKVSISADDLAKWANTISYEIICSLGNRLPRIYTR
jgi:alanine racemase